jgi:hypothetical protein
VLRRWVEKSHQLDVGGWGLLECESIKSTYHTDSRESTNIDIKAQFAIFTFNYID